MASMSLRAAKLLPDFSVSLAGRLSDSASALGITIDFLQADIRFDTDSNHACQDDHVIWSSFI